MAYLKLINFKSAPFQETALRAIKEETPEYANVALRMGLQLSDTSQDVMFRGITSVNSATYHKCQFIHIFPWTLFMTLIHLKNKQQTMLWHLYQEEYMSAARS